MLILHPRDLRELEHHLSDFGRDRFLFRGQTKNYRLPDGSPNLTSSFVRKGCIPPLMLKWIFYSTELLRRGGLDIRRPDILPLTQGFLQHYGWRSFFVDLSSSPSVAAWFAGHSFKAATQLHLCENLDESPVLLRVLGASYGSSDGSGYLYVLDRALLKGSGHVLVGLEDELTTDCECRFQTQQAWLAGIYTNQRRLEPTAISAIIEAPASVFREFAAVAGFSKTGDIFPGPERDKLLENLLSLPWEQIEVPAPIFPAYKRTLEIPEYQGSYPKHLPNTMALYTPLWLSDIEPPKAGEIWFRVSDEIFYGKPEVGKPLPRLSEYLLANDIVNIESRGLICYPAVNASVTYGKGVSIRHCAPNMVEIGAITIDHPSHMLVDGGFSEGYTYELVNSRLIRRPSLADCPCGDPDRHELHLYAIAVLDDLLGSNKVKRDGRVIEVGAG